MQLEETSDLLERAKRASEVDLFRGLELLTTNEHGIVLKVLVIVGELEARRAYAKKAYPSMFDLCVRSLKYSEGQACRRLRAARAIRKYPALFKKLAAREITLTNLAAIQKHLTDENHEELANAVGTNRTRDVERILATWFPQNEKKPLIRKLPDIQHATLPLQTPPPPTTATPQHVTFSPAPPPPPPPTTVTPEPSTPRPPPTTVTQEPLTLPTSTTTMSRPLPRAEVKAESAARYRAHFTMSNETYDRLERIRERTKGCAEAGDLDRLMERAIRLLEEDVNRRVRAEVKQEERRERIINRQPKPANKNEKNPNENKNENENENENENSTIARATKRAVFRRDEERCTFRDENGKRCPARAYFELDHIIPKAKGGSSSEANLRVRCRSHNRLAAEDEFGSAYIDRKISEARSRTTHRLSSPP